MPVVGSMEYMRTRSAPRSGVMMNLLEGSSATWCGCVMFWRTGLGPGWGRVKSKACCAVEADVMGSLKVEIAEDWLFCILAVLVGREEERKY